MGENTKKRKTELSNDRVLNQNTKIKRKSNWSHKNTKLSKKNNLFVQKNERLSASCGKNSSATTNNGKQSYSKEIVPTNGLQLKNKSTNLNVLKNKEPNKNVSKQLLKIANDRSTKMLKSKLIQNKLQQVMLKKGFNEKILNGNSIPTIGKKVLVSKQKPSVEITEKTQISNGKKKPPELIKLSNNKPITYLLRPKGLISNKKMTENFKIENTVQNDILKFGNIDNKATIISSDTLHSNQIIAQDSNNYDQVIDFIKTEHKLVNESIETELNVINKEHNSFKCPEIYVIEEECDKVKPCAPIDDKNKKPVSNVEQDNECHQLDR